VLQYWSSRGRFRRQHGHSCKPLRARHRQHGCPCKVRREHQDGQHGRLCRQATQSVPDSIVACASYTEHTEVRQYSRLWKLLKTLRVRLSSLCYQVLECSFRVSSHKRGSCSKQWTLCDFICVYALILWNSIQSTMKQPINKSHSISRRFSGLWIGSRSIHRGVLQLLFPVKSSQPILSSYLYEDCGHWRLLLKVEQYQCFVTKTVSFGEFN
jgi:hypothetical protein